jgi:N-acetylmuramic acid 6-phosphate etherase
MQLEEFLKRQSEFALGHLPTEGFHPETRNLSELVHQDLMAAIKIVQNIDIAAMDQTAAQSSSISALAQVIQKTFQNKRRVFLTGCGATGRLALALESTWRKSHAHTELENSVQGLMAGGDFALVKSVENFEDFPDYGRRHLRDLGFTSGDLLIAITEGGETPYVIGTVHEALSHVQDPQFQKPWFVYCNPSEILCKTVERSRLVIENPNVNNLCIETGPMALSGSTRLQAATAQMLAVGAALWNDLTLIQRLREGYALFHLSNFLKPAVEWESKVYRDQNFVMYQSDDFPIAVLTDTTERSPTFSLTPFEKQRDFHASHYSLCYLGIPSVENAEGSWVEILNRQPIGLEWEELNGRLGRESILEFDFSGKFVNARALKLFPCEQKTIELNRSENRLEFFTDQFSSVAESDLLSHPLLAQLLVKMILNTHSLMVMGMIGRYEGNVMTWVRSSNGKLIDRTLRYLDFLIEKRQLPNPGREKLLEMMFQEMTTIGPNDAMVLKILEKLTVNSHDAKSN